MIWLFSLFLALDLIALLACSQLLVAALKQRSASQRPTFILLVIAVGLWALFTTLAMISQDERWYIFWRDLVFSPLSLVPPLLFIFTLEYTDRSDWLPGRQRLWLFLLPGLTQVVLTLNPTLGWLYKDTQTAQVGIFRYTTDWGFGPWYMVHAASSYALIVASLGVTLGLLFRLKPYQRRSALLLFFGILVPFLINIPFAFQLLPPDFPDPHPLALALASLLISQAIRRHRLLDLLPIDRSTLFDLMVDALIALDRDEQVVDLNPAAERLLDVSVEQAQGQRVCNLLSTWGILRRSFEGNQGFESEIDLDVSGEGHIFRLRATSLWSHGGDLSGWLLALNDITQLKHAQTELLHLATTDPLTGVANRRHFFHHASFEMNRADRYGHAISVLMIDLDDFKLVNDRLGHAAGDRVLAEAAQRMRQSLRQADLLARYGGEEFVALLPESSQSQSWAAALRLHAELTSPTILIEGNAILVTASVGVATRLPGSSDTLDELLHRADRALYKAKQAGKNCVRVSNGSS
jgi:diguanylate cyclase (GGDEF)-like protein/PAS domain S-box-containing protein